MTNYSVDSARQAMRSTGIVNEVKDWIDGADGKRKQSDQQSRDENTGMPLWEVEVLYRQQAYGRESNTTSVVRVGSPVKPVLAEFVPIRFEGLTVEVRMLRGGTGLGESWRAESIVDEKANAQGSKAA